MPQTQPRIWSGSRRGAAIVGGLPLFVVSLVLGATIFAQGATSDVFARALVITFFVLALLGLYITVAGIWGGWSPAKARTRVRFVRIALAWAILTGAYMCWGLPIGTMSKAEWANFAIFAALLSICIFGFIGIASRVRATVIALGVAATYGAFWSIKFLVIFGSSAVAGGPAMAISFTLARSFSVALVAAFALAWPLRGSVVLPVSDALVE